MVAFLVFISVIVWMFESVFLLFFQLCTLCCSILIVWMLSMMVVRCCVVLWGECSVLCECLLSGASARLFYCDLRRGLLLVKSVLDFVES